MIIVTPEAAAQIKKSAVLSDAQDVPLRIAVERKADGSFHYAMGFDDQPRPGDLAVESEGVALVVNGISEPLLKGTMLDFIDLDGAMEFVFMNPNDPQYKPPQV